MNQIATIQRLFGSRYLTHDCAMDAAKWNEDDHPRKGGKFAKKGDGASSPAPKANVSEQAHAAAKAKVAENAAKPKKPAKPKAEKAAPKAGASAKADVTVSANNMRARALEDGKEIGFVTGEIKDGALCIHKSTLSSREHGKGYGVAMYQALVDKALGQGLRVESDWEPTEQAVRMYGALERRGYTVEKRKPGQELTKKPFTVTGGPEGKAAKAVPKEKAQPKPKETPASKAEVGGAPTPAKLSFTKSELSPIAQRIARGENSFIDYVKEHAGASQAQAEKVLDYYLKHKLMKIDAGIGQFNVKHGGYLEKDVLKRAISEAEGAAAPKPKPAKKAPSQKKYTGAKERTDTEKQELQMRSDFSTIEAAANAVPQQLADAKGYSPDWRGLLQAVRNMKASPHLGAAGMESIRKASRGVKPVAAGEPNAAERNALLAALKQTKAAKPKAPKKSTVAPNLGSAFTAKPSRRRGGPNPDHAS